MPDQPKRRSGGGRGLRDITREVTVDQNTRTQNNYIGNQNENFSNNYIGNQHFNNVNDVQKPGDISAGAPTHTGGHGVHSLNALKPSDLAASSNANNYAGVPKLDAKINVMGGGIQAGNQHLSQRPGAENAIPGVQQNINWNQIHADGNQNGNHNFSTVNNATNGNQNLMNNPGGFANRRFSNGNASAGATGPVRGNHGIAVGHSAQNNDMNNGVGYGGVPSGGVPIVPNGYGVNGNGPESTHTQSQGTPAYNPYFPPSASQQQVQQMQHQQMQQQSFQQDQQSFQQAQQSVQTQQQHLNLQNVNNNNSQNLNSQNVSTGPSGEFQLASTQQFRMQQGQNAMQQGQNATTAVVNGKLTLINSGNNGNTVNQNIMMNQNNPPNRFPVVNNNITSSQLDSSDGLATSGSSLDSSTSSDASTGNNSANNNVQSLQDPPAMAPYSSGGEGKM
jgi:hypothetical protein